jgi:chromosome segregation ATPase
MDGDQTNNEILRAIGSLESAVQHLSDNMSQLCEFKDALLATKQEFEDYKAGREGIPEKIAMLEGKTNVLESNYCNLKTLAEATASEVSTLKKWADKASGIQMLLQALILVGVFLSPFIIWWLGG